MKVKTRESLPTRIGFMDAGWEFEGELIGQYFVITNGFLAGTKVHKSVCELVGEEKVYTEKEWNDLKEHHQEQLRNEKKQSASFQEAGRLLTEIAKEKNKEIERLNFFVDVLSVALKTACDSISVMQQQDKYKTRS